MFKILILLPFNDHAASSLNDTDGGSGSFLSNLAHWAPSWTGTMKAEQSGESTWAGYMAPTTEGTQQEMQSPPGNIGKLL